MPSLKTGTYLGEVLDITRTVGVLAGTTSYQEGDATGVMHYHENPHLSFVLRGGGAERRRRSEFERLPGQVMFFHAGESHQCINKLFPAKNLNLEIEHAFLQGNLLTESDITSAVSRNPDVKFVMLRVYQELLAGTALRTPPSTCCCCNCSAPPRPAAPCAPGRDGLIDFTPCSTTGGTNSRP